MADDLTLRLAGCLSAVESRSGEAIAAELGCSRTAVWKHVGTLRELGIGVEAVAGRGYRLREPLELLDRHRVTRAIAPAARQLLHDVRLCTTVDSTNAELWRMPAASQHGVAILAERQTAGRGRRGRNWFSPFGRNIYLSLGWRFEAGAGELGCLPLVVALAAAEALQRSGVTNIAIKWPNDLLADGAKLGGCLVEIQGDASGPCSAVMGVGINVCMPVSTAGTEAIDQAWADVGGLVPGVSRNALAAALLECLLGGVREYGEAGFDPFAERWRVLDSLAGHEVRLIHGSGTARGMACGISARGGLLINTGGGEREYLAGEVSRGPRSQDCA